MSGTLTPEQARLSRLEDEVRRIAIWAWGEGRAPSFPPLAGSLGSAAVPSSNASIGSTILERAAQAVAEADANGRANLYGANPELYTRLARAALMAVRSEAHELHLVGDTAMRDGREADGVFIAMIEAILNEQGAP